MRRSNVLRLVLVSVAMVMLLGWVSTLAAPPAEAGPAAAPAPETPAAAQQPKEITLWYLIQAGSWMMYPLELMSVLTIAIIIERLVRLRRSHVMPPVFLKSLTDLTSAPALDPQRGLDLCRQHPSAAARIFERAFRRAGRPHIEVEKAVEDAGLREVSHMKANIRMLSMIGLVAPLMGLLGTVSGIIRAFIRMTQGGMGKPEMIAAGMYEALVNTAAGLMVAIPAVAFYYYLAHRVDKVVRELDTIAVDLIEAVGVTGK